MNPKNPALDPIGVHHLSGQPTEAWEELKESESNAPHVMRFKVKPPSGPVQGDKVRVVCMSDTHSLTCHLKRTIPAGDIFIHAGDFTRCGHVAEVKEFNSWLATLPHKHKIVIAGNHELSFDENLKKKMNNSTTRSTRGVSSRGPGGCDAPGALAVTRSASSYRILDPLPCLGSEGVAGLDEAEDVIQSVEDVRQELTECIYLEDNSVTLYGLKIYGTPWQPEFCGWAFNLPRGKACLEKWDNIPDDTDILITHTPPVGYGDLCCTGVRAGCVELLSTVRNRVRPKYHIYGHIHEGYGVRSDGKVVFINASTCDINYMPTNKPIVFDIPLPPGCSKE